MNNNGNKNQKSKPSHRRGLRVGCINVRGIVSNPDKRIDLNTWMDEHKLDIGCVQEWLVPRNVKVSKNKRNGKNDVYNNENSNCNMNDNFSSDEEIVECKDVFVVDKDINMGQFEHFEKISQCGNTKTMIFYRSDVDIQSFEHFDNIDIDGLDVSWVSVSSYRCNVVIGSIYHRPSKEKIFDYSGIIQQMNRIKSELKDDNREIIFLLNGDFNAKHEGWGSTVTDDRGEFVIDWMGENGLSFINNGDFTHYKNGKGEVLDLALISSKNMNLVHEWSVSRVTSSRKKYGTEIPFSDHRGMITVLNFDPKIRAKPDRITWNFDESKIPEFKEKLIPLMIEWRREYEIHKNNVEMVDELAELFQVSIVQAAIDVFGFKTYNSQSVNWADRRIHMWLIKKNKITNYISHLIKKMKKKYGSIVNSSKDMKKKLKKKKHDLNKLQKKLKRRKYNNILESTHQIEKLLQNPNIDNTKVFYDTVNKISNRSKRSIPPLRDPKTEKVIARTDKDIADKIHIFFGKEVPRNEYEEDHKLFHNHVNDFVKNYCPNHNNQDSIVNRKYTIQEVLFVLNTINVQSAMAFDLIHYQLLSWAKTVIVTNLTLLLNLCFYIHQYCPKVWKYGEFVPVPKPGRDHSLCKNIRPIMILPGLARLIGKLNCNRLLTDCIQRKLISSSNCAFQCNRGPTDITNELTERIFRSIENGHFLEVLVMDLNKAYDSVWLNGLIYRLINDYDYDGNIIAWYLVFLRGRFTRLKYNGINTIWRPSLDNLPQGLNDSTILFILLFNRIDLNGIRDMVYVLGIKCRSNNQNDMECKNKQYNSFSIANSNLVGLHGGKSNTKLNYNTNHVNGVAGNIDGKVVSEDLKNNFDNDDGIEKESVSIDSFQVDMLSFADDGLLAMKPLLYKCKLSKMIKYNYRLNVQLAANNLFYWTRMYQLVLSKAKCSSITFSRKDRFRAYVYKLGNDKLELVHAAHNGPQECIHNERANYVNPNFNKCENNGDSDLECLDSNGNKTIKLKSIATLDPNNPINIIRKTGIHAKRQKNYIHQLPTSVRILGVHFDPEMYLNPHIDIVLKKAGIKLYHLIQLAHCRYYRFRPSTIIQLYETVIRPSVEYALCTFYGASKWNLLHKLHKRAIRIALRARMNTPSLELFEIVNGKTTDQRLQEAQIKLWHKYKRAPDYLLQHHTFNDWKEYIESN